MGEAGIEGQLLGCEPTFDEFDAARENSFADVATVAPAITEEALQLQESEYVMVSCQGDTPSGVASRHRISLAPVLPEKSDGHMTLECF